MLTLMSNSLPNATRRWAVSVWSTESDDIIRLVLHDENKDQFLAAVKGTFPNENHDRVESIVYSLLFVDPSVLSQSIPGIMNKTTNPVTGETGTFWQIIQRLNDSTDWTREQIADWLDTCDNAPKFDGGLDGSV